MLKIKLGAALFFAAFILISFFYQGCDGIFPTQTKANVPDDHTSNYGGFLHRGDEEEGGGDELDDCEECHGYDLRGKIYNYNGTLIVTSSCYQCHGNVWEEEGGDKK